MGSVMVSVLASSAVGRGFEQTDLLFVYPASPLSTHHKKVTAKIGWLRIRIMRLSGATCLSTDCELEHKKKSN